LGIIEDYFAGAGENSFYNNSIKLLCVISIVGVILLLLFMLILILNHLSEDNYTENYIKYSNIK